MPQDSIFKTASITPRLVETLDRIETLVNQVGFAADDIEDPDAKKALAVGLDAIANLVAQVLDLVRIQLTTTDRAP